MPAPPRAERQPEHRLRGHREFIELLKFSRREPLIREAPVSIEGVVVTGDDAVIGTIRPSRSRAILLLNQFAGRSATVQVTLGEPVDVPAVYREAAGSPNRHEWTVRELFRSMVDQNESRPGQLSGESSREIVLAPHGFRVFEMTRVV